MITIPISRKNKKILCVIAPSENIDRCVYTGIHINNYNYFYFYFRNIVYQVDLSKGTQIVPSSGLLKMFK